MPEQENNGVVREQIRQYTRTRKQWCSKSIDQIVYQNKKTMVQYKYRLDKMPEQENNSAVREQIR